MRTQIQQTTALSHTTMRMIAALVCAALTSMFPTSSRANEHAKPEFELMHLWLTPVEAPALMIVREATRKAGLTWNEHRVEGNFYGVTLALAERVALGLPPTAVFWIGSIDPNLISRSALFRKIPKSSAGSDFPSSLRPEIRELVETNNGYTTLPLVIHLQNVAVANSAAFASIGARVPTTWSEFIEMAPRLASTNIAPIAVSEQRWLLRFLFMSIFAEGLTKSQFAELLTGQVDREQFIEHARRTISTFRALKQYANTDSHNISWSDAVRRVIDGRAAITITGDFAAPALRDQQHVICMLAPGNRFVMWSFDVLAFPISKSEKQSEAQDIAFRALSTRDTLQAFGLKKGGIPVVRDIDPTLFDQCSQRSLKNWQQSERVPLTYDHWRLQLNSMASLAQHVWQDDTLRPEDVAAQLYQELAPPLQ